MNKQGKYVCRVECGIFPSTSEDIDVLIERKENELSPLRQCMEELKNEFIKEYIQAIALYSKIQRLKEEKKKTTSHEPPKTKISPFK